MNWEEIPDGLKFFNHINIEVVLLIWLAHSAFMSLPWIIGYSNKRTLKNLLSRTAFIMLILFTPPLGYFIWTQPITAAGVLFPGWGWLGLILTTLFMLLGVAIKFSPRQAKAKKPLAYLACLLVFLSFGANLSYHPPQMPKAWVAINTHLGPAPNNYFSLAYREFALMGLVQQALNQNAKVILLPENIAVDWLPGTQDQWQAIDTEAKQKGASIILGAQLDHADRSFDNTLIVLGQAGPQYLLARQPMPLGLWRPWSQDNYHAHWLNSCDFNLQGQKIAYLICYEQMVPWPLFSSFMTRHKPDVIINSANQWFSRYSGYIKQHNVMLANARLFGKPSLTAVNL